MNYKEVKQLIKNKIGVYIPANDYDVPFVLLGLDEIDIADIVEECNADYEINIDPKELNTANTLNKLVMLIKRKVSK